MVLFLLSPLVSLTLKDMNKMNIFSICVDYNHAIKKMSNPRFSNTSWLISSYSRPSSPTDSPNPKPGP